MPILAPNNDLPKPPQGNMATIGESILDTEINFPLGSSRSRCKEKDLPIKDEVIGDSLRSSVNEPDSIVDAHNNLQLSKITENKTPQDLNTTLNQDLSVSKPYDQQPSLVNNESIQKVL